MEQRTRAELFVYMRMEYFIKEHYVKYGKENFPPAAKNNALT